jgi:hypothetical protein
MIILGLILILVGLLVVGLKVLFWIGVILLAAGLIAWLVPIGGRTRRWY